MMPWIIMKHSEGYLSESQVNSPWVHKRAFLSLDITVWPIIINKWTLGDHEAIAVSSLSNGFSFVVLIIFEMMSVQPWKLPSLYCVHFAIESLQFSHSIVGLDTFLKTFNVALTGLICFSGPCDPFRPRLHGDETGCIRYSSLSYGRFVHTRP